MKPLLTALAVTTLATALPSVADAAPWQSINQRQENLYQRIEQGVASGALTRREARDLRGRFAALERKEAYFRRDGLDPRERAVLNRDFDALSGEVRAEKHDGQYR